MSDLRWDRGSWADRSASAPSSVVLLGRDHWPEELEKRLVEQGYTIRCVSDVHGLAAQTSLSAVIALFVPARPLGAREVIALRRIREACPETAIVVLTSTASDPDVKRAFESGATTFLSWPFSPDSLRQAMVSGRPAFRRASPPIMNAHGAHMSQASLSVSEELAPDWRRLLIETLPTEAAHLAAVADLDRRLGEVDREWGAVVGEIEEARRSLVLASAELQRVRRLVVQQEKVEDDDSGEPRRVVTVDAEEARRAELLSRFEGVLREAEAHRVVIHARRTEVGRRRQEAIARLSGPVRATYHAAEEAGRLPAIGGLVGNNCASCRSPVPSMAVSAVGRGAVLVCCVCGRLLQVEDTLAGGA